jgi:hypothetical protein
MKTLSLAVFLLLVWLNSPASGAVGPADIPPRERRITLSAQNISFKEVLSQVCRAAHLELDLDAEAVKQAGVSPDAPITISLKNERFVDAMPEILDMLKKGEFIDIFWKLEDIKVIVTTITADQVRTRSRLPDWLKRFYNNGLIANVDKEGQVISIFTGNIAYDEFFPNLKSLPKLRELDLEPSKALTPESLADLAELPALEKLLLYGVNREGVALGNEALHAVSRIKTLRDLTVSDCGVTDEGTEALRGMTQLTNLSLAGNRLTDAALKKLAGLTNLQGLDISGSSWAGAHMTVSDEGLKDLSGLTEIRRLVVNNLNISGNTISFPHLQMLMLSGANVTDSALEGIVKHCPNLRSLHLSYTSVSDKGLKQLATLKELLQLSLDSYQITDEGIGYLTSLPKLTHVELRATGISDKSLEHLAKIKSLTRLDLHGSGQPGVNHGHLFTMKGLQQLKTLPDLRVLWINNFESDTGYLGLRELKQLRLLHLFYTNIKENEEEALQAAMPKTKVSADSGGIKIINKGKQPTKPVTLPPEAFIPAASASTSG